MTPVEMQQTILELTRAVICLDELFTPTVQLSETFSLGRLSELLDFFIINHSFNSRIKLFTK